MAKKALLVATENKIKTTTGKSLSIKCNTMCCHGDAPNAAETVRKVKEEFDKLNIPLKSFLNVLYNTKGYFLL